MGTTVEQVIDRVYREWLSQPAMQPVIAALASSINTSTTTVAIDDSALLPEEADVVGTQGTVFQIGRELFRVVSSSGENPISVTVQTRGTVLGTDAAAHTAGDEVHIGPDVSRQQVFDAVADAVVDLHPQLWVTRQDLLPLEAFTPIDDDQAVDVREVLLEGTLDAVDGVVFRRRVGEVGSSPGLLVPARWQGCTAWVEWDRDFPRPSLEADDLTDSAGSFRLQESWIRLVVLAAAAVLYRTDIAEKINLTALVDQLAAEGADVRGSISASGALTAAYEFFVTRARARLVMSEGFRVAREDRVY